MASRRGGCVARAAIPSGVVETSPTPRRLTTMYLVACLDLVGTRLTDSHWMPQRRSDRGSASQRLRGRT
jgi:hypothetical protein